MPGDPLTREILGNIDATSRGVMYALAAVSMGCAAWGIHRRARLWKLGRDEESRLSWGTVLKRLVTDVLSQSKLRQGRRGEGVAHRLLFGGFGLLLIGTGLIAVEHYAAAALGRPPGDPLFHKGWYFAVYELVLDTAGLAMLAGCLWFAQRRWRGASSIGHASLDWAVLGMLIAIGLTGYCTEGLRILREQTPQPGYSYVGLGAASVFKLLGTTRSAAATIHFGLWWLHTLLAFGLIAAFPYTRLLHAIAGAASIASGTEKSGVMTPLTMEEVEETGLIGVGRIQDFTQHKLMQLDACVSCGRCQDACPAHEAGKPLSPRNVVQDIRAHLNDVGPRILNVQQSGVDECETADGIPPLAGEVISADTAWSCTTCHACVDICPLGVDPLGLITDLRRNLIGEGQLRGAPATSLQKMQRSGNPWGLPADERDAWAAGLEVPTVEDNPQFEILYWVGCAASYDRRIQKVARALVKLLKTAGVNFAVLGPRERCTGESARRMGDEFLFQELAATNVETLNQHNVKKIITHCPHCLNSLKNDYPQFGGKYEVLHHSQLLMELVEQGKLPDLRDNSPSHDVKLAYHDPCYLARVQGVVGPPRHLLGSGSGAQGCGSLVEMSRSGSNTSCCGAGGGRMWFDDSPDERIGASRVQELLDTGAEALAVSCPFCLTMIGDGVAATSSSAEVKDIAELLAEALGMNDS